MASASTLVAVQRQLIKQRFGADFLRPRKQVLLGSDSGCGRGRGRVSVSASASASGGGCGGGSGGGLREVMSRTPLRVLEDGVATARECGVLRAAASRAFAVVQPDPHVIDSSLPVSLGLWSLSLDTVFGAVVCV